MPIEKSLGQTPTERYLAQLCDRTFLRPWSYANPFKADGKELCDLIAVFENNVFLFFDRESRKFDTGTDVALTWERWRKVAITRQVQTASGGSVTFSQTAIRFISIPTARYRCRFHP